MKKILVLGGTGFVGAHVCEKLARHGWQVTVPTRRRANALAVQHLPGLTVLELNVHDEAALASAVAGQDAVVNLVAILHGDQATFEHVHVALPQKLARVCLAAGVAQVVHVSALGADALQPARLPSMYLRTKSEGEAVLLQAAQGGSAGAAADKGFDLSILRPSVIFGAQDKFLNLFAKLQKILPVMPLAGASARFQPVWVEDVASAVVACLQSDVVLPSPRTIELAGPQVFTLKQLVQLAAQLSGTCAGRGRPVLPLPDWAGRLQASLMGFAPGEPLMSLDNLDSMKIDNVASGKFPDLDALGIHAAALEPVAQAYLSVK
ncbi:MAG: complex I NDUFA9 subunit family protein [Betaproteobacteria bacterium]|nr:complex I NDUFA9 subunit family protein [Betaproteobacteria bacterium]NCP82004.1 complex I NDUFA9 subunit family protein [Rhodoferax sp.]NCS62128.1 complex I NDUFA9 subunit family protein [Rhodoferax sp.]PIZ22039.1 MAG: NAD-dependent dehydratase [Comamonadaceae bacterium CG_4_10_14_0_8_um_filter_57_29]PJC22798.1 MAG: NAD-dependent dehydratase [Comamonadaceae bacterium CG_4_9_14_0_8_um_filter_57_21]